ncbi:hypothetical protein [Mesorhizobium sp.]|uniref:hypothetical protein n=1 Tax=Mesorhizobium sp. TaxID=1871066 RepID=UPI00257F0DF2|nr:hypothetical protein [Mesorhizobium sp.]
MLRWLSPTTNAERQGGERQRQLPKRLPCGLNGPVLLMTSMHAMFGPYPPPFFFIG